MVPLSKFGTMPRYARLGPHFQTTRKKSSKDYGQLGNSLAKNPMDE
jgi:hypothetical protein